MPPFHLLRSLLYVPGSRPDFLQKAAAAGADALVLDLEDSVPPAGKDEARRTVAAALRQSAGRLTFIRINHPSLGQLEKDLSVLAAHGDQAIMLPKVEQVEDVSEVDRALTRIERDNGIAPHAIAIMVGIESNLGVRNLFDVLGSTQRARGAVLASAEEGDLMVDTGGQWTPTGEALAYARGKFVCDARAAGATYLLDGAFMNLQGTDALRQETTLARTMGFTGKTAIHPRQVAVINEVFSPTAQEVDRARKLLQVFRAAEAEGRGAVQFEGMMVDYANVKRAEQILALAETL
ncbi:MAG TPA: CoA ester lyase [Xanthobacteraceae bacterium]